MAPSCWVLDFLQFFAGFAHRYPSFDVWPDSAAAGAVCAHQDRGNVRRRRTGRGPPIRREQEAFSPAHWLWPAVLDRIEKKGGIGMPPPSFLSHLTASSVDGLKVMKQGFQVADNLVRMLAQPIPVFYSRSSSIWKSLTAPLDLSQRRIFSFSVELPTIRIWRHPLVFLLYILYKNIRVGAHTLEIPVANAAKNSLWSGGSHQEKEGTPKRGRKVVSKALLRKGEIKKLKK